MLLCVLFFYISRCGLLSVYLYLVNLNTWLRVRGIAFRLATAPEFSLLFLYARILYVYSGLLK